MKVNYDNTSSSSIFKYSKQFLEKSLRDILDESDTIYLSTEILKYKGKRKGLFGDIIEEYLFGIRNNSDKSSDFKYAGVELKTTPLKKHTKNKYSAKERLVFSMIDYMSIIDEVWDTSSFLKKNKLLLLMFYLFEKDKSILDYKFKFVKLLNLLSEISEADIVQIKKDWETIVNKIKAGEAHLLSEGDTAYLGAATKASKSTDRRPQPNNSISAKPRAFSLKTTYINYLIQRFLGKEDKNTISLIDKDKELPLTIEENIYSRFNKYLNKTNLEIEESFSLHYKKRPKNHRRLLINKLLGASSNKIEEFEKANITLKVVALEPSGKLVESISFPIFRYKEIVNEIWEESDFFNQLNEKRFLFVIFQKTKEGFDVLRNVKFWNFPMKDIDSVKWVWEETVKRIKNKQAYKLPSIKENAVAHVRPHGRNSNDKIDTGYGTKEVKKCFWLNAKYIEEQLNTKNLIN